MKELIKPGTDNQKPGKYKEVDSSGNDFENQRFVEIQQGDRLPPTQASGHCWIAQ